MAYDKTHRHDERDANRDPLSGAPGAHPVGTGVGAAAGGMAAGAAMGTVAGPVGTVIGAAAGAVIGGLAGKAVAEKIDPTAEEAYWRDNFRDRPYAGTDASYDDYGPAYRYGLGTYDAWSGTPFDVAEPELSAGWARRDPDGSTLEWERARHAVHDTWVKLGDRARRDGP